jgi:hypothetical protein
VFYVFIFLNPIYAADKDSAFYTNPIMVNLSGAIHLDENLKFQSERIYLNYLIPLKEKSYVGIQTGYSDNYTDEFYWNPAEATLVNNVYYMKYMTERMKYAVFNFGFNYRLNFEKSGRTPFIGVDTKVLLVNIYPKHINYPAELHNWDFGYSAHFFIGYSWRFGNNTWGVEFIYSTGMDYLNNTFNMAYDSNYSVIKYTRKYEHYFISNFRIGLNYYFKRH